MRVMITTLVLNLILWIIILVTIMWVTDNKLNLMRWETTSSEQLRMLNRECFKQKGISTVRVAVITQDEPRTYYITCKK